MANPYAVDFGGIPFSSAPGAMFGAMGGSPQQAMSALGPAYQSSYNAALDFNKQLGSTINTGYNRAMEQQLSGQQAILGDIAGYGDSSRHDIAAANTKQQGDAMQSLIGRGLGNFTVLDSAKRGYNDDLARQNLQLDDQLANMRAGYRNQFNQQNTGLAGNQLGFLERMTGQYPNAGLYGQLASQFGAAQQSAANQGQLQDALDRARTASQPGATMGAINGGGNARPQRAFGPQVGGGGDYGGGGGGFGGGYGGAFGGIPMNPIDYMNPVAQGVYGGGGDWGEDMGQIDFSPYLSEGQADPWSGGSFMSDAWGALGGGAAEQDPWDWSDLYDEFGY